MNITQILDACTGCGVCAAVCPSAAVKMQPDAHGFLRPVVDDAACTDCGLCTRKCPVSVLPQNSAHTDVLTGYAKDGALLPRSSSGAIFPVLAAEIIRKGGLVFGAAFDGQFQVVHTAAESVEELSALCSSKYVQGRIPSDCYAQVKAAVMAVKAQIDSVCDIQNVPCHNDPLCENWVVSADDDRLYLIDWEYAGMNDGIWDLADVSIEGVFTPENDELLLTEYLGSKPDQNEYKHFLANKIYVDYLWTLWAKTRVPYDGQPMEDWAVERYARLKDNLRLFAEA